MEPSRRSPAKRRRKLLALARELDDELGPDQSRVVFEYGDGWTMRRVERLEDQVREGRLVRNCLASVRDPAPDVYSLRDPDNLPHLTPAVYRVAPGDNLDGIPLDRPIDRLVWFVLAGSALFLVDAARSGGLKPERRQQLVRYGQEGDPSAWECLPSSNEDWLDAMLPFFALQGSKAQLGGEIEGRYRAQVRQLEATEQIRRVHEAIP